MWLHLQGGPPRWRAQRPVPSERQESGLSTWVPSVTSPTCLPHLPRPPHCPGGGCPLIVLSANSSRMRLKGGGVVSKHGLEGGQNGSLGEVAGGCIL